MPSMHVGCGNGTPEQQVCPFLQTFAPHSSSGGTGGHDVIVQPHLPPWSTHVGPAVEPSQQSLLGASGPLFGQAPSAVQSSFGGGPGGTGGVVVVGAGAVVVGAGAGAGLFSSDVSLSVGSSVRSLPCGVLEHARVPRAIKAKLKVRAFIVESSV
jgi:hypothetical protein